MNVNQLKLVLKIMLLILCLNSCAARYTTPGASVNISELADEDIAQILANKPTAAFPVNLAIARIQSSNYMQNNSRRGRVFMNHDYGSNTKFSMILTRNSEEDKAFEELSKLEGINQAAPFNRLLLPYNYTSIKDLRLAAAKMKSHMLLVYTFNTEFIIETKNYGPQNVFTLGYLKNKEVKVVTTASAAIFDVQTEYLFGLAEATSTSSKTSNSWKKKDEVDALKLKTEQDAFNKLLTEIKRVWQDIKEEYNNAK